MSKPEADKIPPPPPRQEPAVAENDDKQDKGKPRGSIIVLSLLFSLMLFAGLGLLLMAQSREVDELAARVAGLRGEVDDNASATASIRNLQQRLIASEEQLADASLKIEEQNEQLALAGRQLQLQREQLGNLSARYRDQATELAALGEDVVDTRLQLNAARSPVADINEQWLLAEAESLVRLARQRLTVARDVGAAIALLQAADEILGRVGGDAVLGLRDAINADLGALHATRPVDIMALYTQIGQLAERVASLPLASPQERLADTRALSWRDPEEEGGEQDWLRRALAQLERLVTVRRLDAPVSPLPSGEEARLLRLRMTLALEQARLGLLRREGEVYRDSLNRAANTVEAVLADEGGDKQAVLDDLRRLHDVEIAPALPELSASLQAFQNLGNEDSEGREGNEADPAAEDAAGTAGADPASRPPGDGGEPAESEGEAPAGEEAQ